MISATLSLPDPVGDLVVDLARQQPQRQADHAGRVSQHALDGEMGLAGVGRAEHGSDAGATKAAVAGRGRRERDRHQISRLGRPASARARDLVYHNATGPKRAQLTPRTSLERNAPESLTPALSDFVHGDISTHSLSPCHNIGYRSAGFGSHGKLETLTRVADTNSARVKISVAQHWG